MGDIMSEEEHDKWRLSIDKAEKEHNKYIRELMSKKPKEFFP